MFENVLVGATFGTTEPAGRRPPGPSPPWSRRRHGRQGEPSAAGSLRLLDRKRLELAGPSATSPKVLLLDEIAGGLTEGGGPRADRQDP